MTTAMIDSDEVQAITATIRAAEGAVRRLVAEGRAELDGDAQEAAQKARDLAENKAAARRAVLAQIKQAVLADGQVPRELHPYMRAEGLGSAGECPNGWVTICVDLPGLPEGDYVAFNVCQTPNPGRWYVKGEWIARAKTGGTQAFPTFTRAVASAFDAGPTIPF